MYVLNVNFKCAGSNYAQCYFCIVRCFVMDHLAEAYSSIVLVTALYVENNVSLCLFHLVEERSMVIVLNTLTAMVATCLL